MRSRRRSSERGFTITELLVALTVTVIGLAGLLSLHVATVRGNATAAGAAEAMTVAEETLEEHRGMTIKAIDARYGALPAIPAAPPSSSNFPIGSATESVVTLAPVTGRNSQLFYRRLYAVEVTGQPNLIRFRVVVYWYDRGGIPGNVHDDTPLVPDHRIELQTVRTRVEVM